jgi:hypothetical protein
MDLPEKFPPQFSQVTSGLPPSPYPSCCLDTLLKRTYIFFTDELFKIVDTYKREWKRMKQQAGARALTADIRTNHGTFFHCLSAVSDFAASLQDEQLVSCPLLPKYKYDFCKQVTMLKVVPP